MNEQQQTTINNQPADGTNWSSLLMQLAITTLSAAVAGFATAAGATAFNRMYGKQQDIFRGENDPSVINLAKHG
jgi:hypothetical protein